MQIIKSLDSLTSAALFDLQVDEQPTLIRPDGSSFDLPGFEIRRADTGDHLAFTSDRYGAVSHRSFLEQVTPALEEAAGTRFAWGPDLKFNELKRDPHWFAYASPDGGIFKARFVLPNHSEEVKKGDRVGMSLELSNSVNKRKTQALNVGEIRLLCTNGMTGFHDEISLSRRHTKGNTLGDETIRAAIEESFSLFAQDMEVYRNMDSIALSREEVKEIINSLPFTTKKKGEESKKKNPHFERIEQRFARSQFADNDQSLWGVYNAVTEHLTHYVAGEKGRVENADNLLRKVNTRFQSALSLGNRNEIVEALVS